MDSMFTGALIFGAIVFGSMLGAYVGIATFFLAEERAASQSPTREVQ